MSFITIPKWHLIENIFFKYVVISRIVVVVLLRCNEVGER